MSKQTFLIALTTTEIPASETEYSIGAAKMAEIFDSIFMDRGVIGKLTKAATLSACHTEVEVSMGESGLVGRAVVELTSESRVQIDKGMLSRVMRKAAPWEGVKVEKQVVQEAVLIDLEEEGGGEHLKDRAGSCGRTVSCHWSLRRTACRNGS